MSNHTTSSWRERLASPLSWHYAGCAVLLAAVIGLAIRFSMDWSAINGSSTDALATKQLQLKALSFETAPLRGFDKRIADSRAQVQAFYQKRIPSSYSSIATRTGALALNASVRLSRVEYTQGPPGSNLTEISMEAGITGGYPQIMRFVNSLERDQTFFVIRGLSLTGQQGGLVNLQLRLSTWLRPADAVASGFPSTPKDSDTSAAPANVNSPSASEKEGE
jgi:hypothetical protein